MHRVAIRCRLAKSRELNFENDGTAARREGLAWTAVLVFSKHHLTI